MQSHNSASAAGQGLSDELCFGSVPPAERIGLRAGPLAMVFEPRTAFLRHIRVGGQEVLLNVYAALRDRNWGTVAPVLSDLVVRQGDDCFEVTFQARCRRGEVDFAWQGRIVGQPGSVRVDMDGTTLSTFWRNRLGFCVLHPVGLAGQPCKVEHVDGSIEAGRFPGSISPHQPFLNIRAIRHEVLPGLIAEVRMEGDTFEMEDQRNWTDASFKTYCTPLALPMPAEVAEGTRIVQSVTLRLDGTLPAAAPRPIPSRLTFTIGQTIHSLPAIGLGSCREGTPLAPTQTQRLRGLNLSHLRSDLDMASPGWREVLASAASQAAAVQASLELALHLADPPRQGLQDLSQELVRLRPATRSVLLHRGNFPASAEDVAAARELLAGAAAGAAFGTGSSANFTELNRNRPGPQGLDLFCFAMNPQVHAFDCASMVETLATQAAILGSAKRFAGPRPLAVTPVTLRKAGQPADPRQSSLFAAGWTLGSLKNLAAGGAASVTYYETAGPAGILSDASADAQVVFPIYHVLADIAELSRPHVRMTISSDPLQIEGLVLETDRRVRVLMANMVDHAVEVALEGVPGAAAVKVLDASNTRLAMLQPEEFRRQPGTLMKPAAGVLTLTLGPCAIARIDADGAATR